MPFNRPPLDLLIARSAASMQSRLPGTDAVLRRSLSGIVARMSAGTEHGLYGYLDWLARQLMPDTAEEEHLERWASIWGVSRKAAGHASGDVSITGTPGTVLPEGTICLRSDAVRYAVVSDATVGDDGTGTAFLSAVDAGTAGNAPIGTVLALASPVSGLDSRVQAADGLTGGTDEETDESLKSRLLATIQRTPMGGTQADYEQWALEVPGVTRAFVSMEKAAALEKPCIFAIGNAPTALLSLEQLMEEGKAAPALIIGVPVGFVNVEISKERIIEKARAPYIVARGRKGGSNVAAAICNALLYQIRR